MRKPRVHTSCVANNYAGPTERIVEFSFPGAGDDLPGGLISFRYLADGSCMVQLYRLEGVKVTVEGEGA